MYSRNLSLPSALFLLLLVGECILLPDLAGAQSQSRPLRHRPRQRRLATVTDETELIRELTAILSSNRIAVIRFYADWCPVCKSDAPEFLKVVGKYPLSTAKFFKVDVDQHPRLVSEYGIRAVPTYFILERGVSYVTFHTAPEVDNYLKVRRR